MLSCSCFACAKLKQVSALCLFFLACLSSRWQLRTEGMEWSRQRETIEDTSRAQLVALQQERNSLQEQLRAEVRDHQALRNSVREDRMRQENTMEQLKQELNELAKKYQALKVSSEERETELRREVDRLHGMEDARPLSHSLTPFNLFFFVWHAYWGSGLAESLFPLAAVVLAAMSSEALSLNLSLCCLSLSSRYHCQVQQ